MKELKHSWKIFADEFIKTGKGKQSAIAAGYSEASAESQACRLLKKAIVKNYIDQQIVILQDTTNTSPERLLQELSAIAYSNIKDVLEERNGEVTIKKLSEISDFSAKAIQEYSETPTKYGTERKVKFFPKISAIDTICKMHGLYISIHDILDKMESSEAEKLLERYLKKKKEISI